MFGFLPSFSVLDETQAVINNTDNPHADMK
jgi:hypothetical protein